MPKRTFLFSLFILSLLQVNAQNVGIGTPTPLAKIHVNQTAAIDGVLVDLTGASGNALDLNITNAANTSEGISLDHAGLGRGGVINLTNASNTDIGWGIWTAGSGTAIYGSAVGNALFGASTGTTGTAGTFTVSNTAADKSSLGLFVQYNGTGNTGAGGGNAAEFQHNGTNGNAMDIYVGSPASPPGPANTTSDYSCIYATHMGTGTSATDYKSAVQAHVNGSDPAIVSLSNGTGDRQGILSFANPNGFSDPQAVYGYSYTAANAGYGIGVRGTGGWYGVQGIGNGGSAPATFAVYGSGDYGGTGAKYFSIDHPLDPENKILNHYSIESNEVTNMYRGIVTLGPDGKAIVALPDYFEATNIEPSYQLTAIGTATVPYIATEVVDNKFSVAGAPNTKVSWTVYAKRNDPTIRYFDENGKNYDQEEVDKPARMKGKYYTPEAYGQPASRGIHYDEQFQNTLDRTKNIQQRGTQQKAITAPPLPVKNKTDRPKPTSAKKHSQTDALKK